MASHWIFHGCYQSSHDYLDFSIPQSFDFITISIDNDCAVNFNLCESVHPNSQNIPCLSQNKLDSGMTPNRRVPWVQIHGCTCLLPTMLLCRWLFTQWHFISIVYLSRPRRFWYWIVSNYSMWYWIRFWFSSLLKTKAPADFTLFPVFPCSQKFYNLLQTDALLPPFITPSQQTNSSSN